MQIKFIAFFLLIINLYPFEGNDGIDFFNSSLQKKADDAEKFCKENNLNTEFCILIDMNIHSGKNRLFVYNFNSKTIEPEGLCSHGCCDGKWGVDWTKSDPVFSNVSESHCSSLGKYKIGKRGYSNW